MSSSSENKNEEQLPKTYHVGETTTNGDLEIVSAMNSLRDLRKETLNFNSPSCSSLNKIALNSLYGSISKESSRNEMKCSSNNKQTSDLKEVKAESSNMERGLENSLDTQSDLNDTSSGSKNDHEQVNIVECLLDLDDYLEKMEESCSAEENNDLNLKISTASSKNDNTLPFERCSKLRNTTVGGHTQSDLNDTSSGSKNDLEQVNIVECLLDLDDYLDTMEESCSAEENNDLNLKRSTASTKNDNTSPFERCSKLRKTTVGLTQKSAPEEHKTISSRTTWNNQMAKKTYHQDESNFNGFFDKNGDNISHLPTANEQSVLPESAFAERFAAENVSGQMLTNEQIFQNLLEQQPNIEGARPRQYGRRAERFSTSASHLRDSTPSFTRVYYENLRPLTDTVSNSIPEVFCNHDMLYTGSDGSTARSSRNTTPVFSESSTDSGQSLPISDASNTENENVNQDNENHSTQPVDSETVFPSQKYGFNSYWPHDYSRTFALISCTLGLFNTCRFANLTIIYGGNFLIQFCILSIIFGIPFLWLQMSLGAKIKAGPISMWKVSPICIGIGISITLVQYFITIYSTIAVVWLLKFIQDIFIYKSSYAWSESLHFGGNRDSSHTNLNITDSIPYYFNANVLQRTKLLKINGENADLRLNDRIAFYLAFVWAAVFLILCKGLKSFGKFILLLGVLPIVFLAAAAVKLLSVVDIVKLQDMFGSSEFDDFLVSSRTWAAAAQETFLTWGLFGASVIAISSRTHKSSSKLALRKDAILAVVVTLLGLCLSAIVGLCSVQILNDLNYVYVPGSYEVPERYRAIFSLKYLSGGNPLSYPNKFVPHYSTVIGEVFRRHADTTNISGYQVLRFITEVLPAAVTVSVGEISWIWTLVIFAAFFLFGLSQLCVLWKPISSALGNSTSAVLLSCVTGLLLGIPFVTESGISLLYYMDLLLGGAWFIPVLWCAEIFGIFLIRGRPYNADDLVNDLKMSGSMSAFLALSWNVLLPIGLITLAIIEYKISQSNQFYYWRGKSYFSYWSRKTAALTQIGFLIFVPIAAIVQMYRYLTSGPPDILDRIQMLYRPLDEDESLQRNLRYNRNISSSNNETNDNGPAERFQNDAPPKYTPPPSYTTATGAKLAKILRQSIRRSVRRILGESEPLRPVLSLPPNETQTDAGALSCPTTNNLVETADETSINIRQSMEFDSRPSVNLIYGRSHSLGRKQIRNKNRIKETIAHPLSARPINANSSYLRRSSHKFHSRPFTAEDVKTILRSSTLGRRRATRSPQLHSDSNFRSIENLVQNAEMPNLSSAIADGHDNRNAEYLASEI